MTANSDDKILPDDQLFSQISDGLGAVSASPVRDIVFIDSRAPDIQDLIAGAKPGETVVLLDPSTDGVEQIADYLAANNLTNLASISIVGHGSSGAIDLGSTVLDEADLTSNAAALSMIGAALAPDGDLALYACDTAAGAAGQQFISDLSRYAGGVDVAAATHLVGDAGHGGSWTLDASTGAPVAADSAPFTDEALANYQGLLAGGSYKVQGTNPFPTLQFGSRIVTADFNHDGNLDILYQTGSTSGAGIFLALGNGNGTFQAPIAQPSSGAFTSGPLTGIALTVITADATVFTPDLGGDGDIIVNPAGNTAPTVYQNNGSGYTLISNPFPSQQFTGRFAFGDFNNDGKTDVLNQTGNTSGVGITLYVNNGNGTFTQFVQPSGAAFTSGPLAGIELSQVTDNATFFAVDLGGEGDIIENVGGNTVPIVYQNNGSGYTQITSPFPSQQFNSRFVFGDFNNDGKIDALNQVSNSSGQGITLYLNNGDGTFTAIAKPDDSTPGAGDAPFTSGPFTGIDFTNITNSTFLEGDFTNNGANDIVNSQSGSSTFLTEIIPPTVLSINRVASATNNATSEAFTVTFSESVTGVDNSDFTAVTSGITDTGISVTGSGAAYTVTVNGVAGSGTLGLNLKSSGTGITDTAGTAIAAGFTGQVYTIDQTPPTVSSINRVGSATNNASSEAFTLVFLEAVTGVAANDFMLTTTNTPGGTALTTGGIISITTSDNTTYSVTVGSVAGDGTLRLDLKPNSTGITDAVGNGATAAFTSGQTYTIEHTPPAAASINRVASATNSATSEAFTVTFSESVTGVDNSDFTAVVSGATDTGISVTGSGATYTVTVNGVAGNGTLGLNLKSSGTGITDTAGNAISGGFTGQVYTIDQTPPTVSSINRVASATNNGTSETFTVTFSESVTGVDNSDFTAVVSGTTDTGISVTGSGATYTVTANGVTGDGTLGLNLKSSGTGITDTAGNAISGGFTGQVYTIDQTPPSVSSINRVGSSPNSASSDAFTVTFSETVTGVDTADFTAITTGTAADTGLSITGSGTTYTVTVNGVTGNGTLGLNLNASGTGITDAAGNAIAAGFTGQVYSIQHTPIFQANVPAVSGPYTGLDQWSVAANWSTDVVPTSGDVDVSNSSLLVDDEASLSLGNVIFPTTGAAGLTVNGALTIANLELGADSALLASTSTLFIGGASSAAVTINGLTNLEGAARIGAFGLGAIITVNAADEGETYQAQSQGKIVLSAAPALTSTFSASSGGAIGFNVAPGTIASSMTIASGGGVEVQGTKLISSSYNSSTHTETITTDAGTYLFTDWLGLAHNLSGGVDATTGLLDLTAASTGSASNPALSNDVDGNGLGGLLWQENGSGRVAVWDMNGTNYVDFGYFSSPGPTWTLLTAGDFNGDGKSDAILEDTTGQIVEWQFNGIDIANAAFLPYTGTPAWQAKATGDFNGDGLSDIALQNTDGSIAIWELNGFNIIANGAADVTNPGPNWQAITTGDFFGTGQSELALQNTTTGALELMGFNASAGGPVLDNTRTATLSAALDPGVDWRLAGTGDFNGDGLSDFVFQNTDGSVAVWEMNGANLLNPTSAAVVGNPGSTWRLDEIADFNGDGVSDLMFQDSQTGLVQFWLMNGLTVASQTTLTNYNPGTLWHPIA